MKDYYVDKIAQYVQQRSRLFFIGHRRSGLLRRLEARITELALPDFSDYWKLLQSSREEEQRLFDLLTTNETSFFRNPAQFIFLKEQIIPRYDSLPTAVKGRLRILCAGCSTGEEPYSVAMTILEVLRYQELMEVEIIAGDLSHNCLAEARAGCYDFGRLKNLPPSYIERYFEGNGEGVVVREQVKQLIRFVHLNLNELMNPDLTGVKDRLGSFDIIFCRNVMIYFSPSCQQLLVETLHELLVSGGYLFTGDAEPLHLFRHEFIPVDDADCLIYQKNREGTQ